MTSKEQNLSLPAFIEIVSEPVEVVPWMRQYIIDALTDLHQRRATETTTDPDDAPDTTAKFAELVRDAEQFRWLRSHEFWTRACNLLVAAIAAGNEPLSKTWREDAARWISERGAAVGSTKTPEWSAMLRSEISAQEALIKRMGDYQPEMQDNGIMSQLRWERLELLQELLKFEPQQEKTSAEQRT